VSLSLRFSVHAIREAREVFSWYEAQHQGLGFDFFKEIEAVTSRLVLFPETGAVTVRDQRQVLLRRFPYLLVYRKQKASIQVLAVVHVKRDPQLKKLNP